MNITPVFTDYTTEPLKNQPNSRRNFQASRFGLTTDEILTTEIQVPDKFSKTQVKRLKIVLPYLLKKFGVELKKEVELYSVELRKIFGEEKMGEHLGKLLLIVIDNTWDYKTEGNTKCKTYKLNVVNYKKISTMIFGSEEKVEEELVKETKTTFDEELRTGEFQYTTVDFRQYHPLVNMPKKIRNKILHDAGYIYEYDIASCAPTIIIERARKSGVKIPFNKEVDRFFRNPKRYRDYIARRANVSTKEVKQTINALIHGSRMSTKSEIFTEILDGSIEKFVRLTANPRFIKFRKSMGRILRELAGEVENGDDMSFGKRTFMLYTEIEQKIRNVWIDAAKEIGAKILLIHDGFNSDVKMDETELTEKIKEEIGFCVKIEGGVL